MGNVLKRIKSNAISLMVGLIIGAGVMYKILG